MKTTLAFLIFLTCFAPPAFANLVLSPSETQQLIRSLDSARYEIEPYAAQCTRRTSGACVALEEIERSMRILKRSHRSTRSYAKAVTGQITWQGDVRKMCFTGSDSPEFSRLLAAAERQALMACEVDNGDGMCEITGTTSAVDNNLSPSDVTNGENYFCNVTAQASARR